LETFGIDPNQEQDSDSDSDSGYDD
jgi:hypothetical protein